MTNLEIKEKIKYELWGMINCLSDNEVKLLFTSCEYDADSLSECNKIIKKYGFSVFGHGATKNAFIFNFNTGLSLKLLSCIYEKERIYSKGWLIIVKQTLVKKKKIIRSGRR